MSRLARHTPDDPDLWAAPPMPVRDPRRRCWCGRPVPGGSLDGLNCAEHDQEIEQ